MADDINVAVTMNEYIITTSIASFIDDDSDIDGGTPSSW